MNVKNEEVTTYDLASRMIDLDVELTPELTKASRSSASTSVGVLDRQPTKGSTRSR
jgi:hypothetical protein